ncbi:MAG: 2Fe-2S iron-sulfur cluster binding domain protein [Osedax symbiont Rs2]|nr:MAG: 2Fe-2S iron-sulfur cluster binding domain protein [Osedax symbiont Rs2]
MHDINEPAEVVGGKKAAVVFTPSGLRGEFTLGTSVLQAAQLLGVDLESSCGGRGICSRCQVVPSIGDFPKHGIHSVSEHLSTLSELEQQHRKLDLSSGRRLSCSTLILGDLVIDVPADSQLHRQHIVKEAGELTTSIKPSVQLYSLQVPEPSMQQPASDMRLLQQQLQQIHEVSVQGSDLSAIQQLQRALAKGGREVTVAVYVDTDPSADIIAVWPGVQTRAYGVAIDLGSTTIAAHLCDLETGEVLSSAASMNPQIRFGEDLMSRVSYVMMNPGGELEMCTAVRQTLAELCAQVAKKAKIERQQILDLSIVCNPIMHHLLLGIDPTPLGTAPFALATEMPLRLKASELDLQLHSGTRVFILPCIAGHIGADTAGMILAERPDLADEITLLVDIGTNAEIVLGDKYRVLAASSPTGPAFEGAQISCGQRAAAGAIERVRIDPQTLEPRFKVIGCDLWSDHADFAAGTRKLKISGICGSGVIELIAELYLAGVISTDGVIDPQMAKKSSRVVPNDRTYSYVLHTGEKILSLTQNDVRAIQLAKAALYAGIRLLMDHMGVSSVARIGLAGAFGSHIDVKYAMLLGLIPDCNLQRVTAVGNAAGSGARIALLNREKRQLIATVLDKVEKIETAIEAKFQDHFVAAMALPHKSDPFVQLSKVVKLPEKKVATVEQGSARGRRRSRSR